MPRVDLKPLLDELQKNLPPEVSKLVIAKVRHHITDVELEPIAIESKYRNLEDKSPPHPKQYISEKQACIKYGMSSSWFRNRRWKRRRTGPPFKKFDRVVRYEVNALDEYMSSLNK
jgi:hypothetical protein